MPKNTELIQLQVPPSDIQPEIARTETDLLLQPTSIYDRLRHFPDSVYDLSAESKLVKFLKVLLGDAGAGQLRKHLLVQRLQSTLQGSHFYNLDRFYGPLFGLRRSVSELLDFDPYTQTQTATRDQWAEAHSKDASFRSRIEQFSRALPYGATPTGMELIAEALLSVDVDIYESWVQADSSFQTYQELEDQYGAPINSENSISIESDASGWQIEQNVSDLSQSDAWYFTDGFNGEDDDQSLRITADGVGDAIVTIVESLNATPNEEYTFAIVTAYFGYLDSMGSPGELELGSGESLGDFMRIRPFIEWYDDGPTLLSTVYGDPVWPDDLAQQAFVTGTAPVSADTAVIGVEVVDPEAGDEVFCDRLEWSLLNYADMEGVLYGDLEGLGLPRLSGNERRTFRIRPKRQITLPESYDLSRVIHKLKPADTRFTLDAKGLNLYDPVEVQGAYSDSEFWEIVPKVNSATFANNPYQTVSGEPEEQPLPPFSGYQGEAWSYITDLAGVAAYSRQSVDAQSQTMPISRVIYADGTLGEFDPEQAMLPARMVYAGRVVSDAIAVAYPYVNARQDSVTREPTPLFVDAVPIKDFLTTLNELPDVDPFQQNLANRYFVTQTKGQDDTIEEILEIRMNRESFVNYLTFETAKFPHRVIVEVYDTEGAEWNETLRWEYKGSQPSVLSPGRESALREGHPHHNYENHWERIRHNFDTPQITSKIRLRMRRIEGEAPKASLRPEAPDVPYSLAIRGLDIGYRVRGREDFDFIEGTSIATTKDMFGSQLSFDIAERKAINALDGTSTVWRSDPQPVNYGVVNFYLDTRRGGDGEVIDRFFLDPTHDGAHLTIYYSMDPDELDDDDPEGFLSERTWTPIPRDFTVQKGNIYIPPTRARYWKFEFTSLTPESFENFVAINRKVQLFPRWIVDAQDIGHGHADEALLPGMKTAIDVADTATYDTYTDAIGVLRQTDISTEEYKPTESVYITDVNVQRNMKDASWVFGFTPWHQGQRAPRFDIRGQHEYETAHVRHSTKVAFFVGLRELKAYRANWEANDDPPVYFDTYDDFRNLEGDFTWAFDPGVLHSVNTTPPVEAESRTFLSRSPIKAVQFATEQSNPVQLIGDPEFQNPALAGYGWDNLDSYLQQGDAQLIYSATDFSVLVIRYVEPPLKPLDIEPGMVQTIHQPVFSWRPFEVADEEALAATKGGIASPLFGLSDAGRAHAAVRFTFQTPQTNPWFLRVIEDGTEVVIAEKSIEGRQGQTVEEFVSFEIPAPNTTARVHLIQEGKSNDSIKLQSMAMFDDSMVWEFSVNGGGDWYEAKEIRNNDNGLLTFPAPGNQLKYRVTAYRDNRWVSAIKIRPHYLGVGNARPTGTHRGSNVSYYDQDVPIHEDPMFTQWKRPVPFYWFAASRRFPLLAVEGDVTDSEFNSFFGRPLDFTLDEPEISLAADLTLNRGWDEALHFTGPSAGLERTSFLYRGSLVLLPEEIESDFFADLESDFDLDESLDELDEFYPPMTIELPEPEISVDWAYVSGIEGGPIHPMVDPVFSEGEEDGSL